MSAADLSVSSVFAGVLHPVGTGDGVVVAELVVAEIMSVQALRGLASTVLAGLARLGLTADDGPRRATAAGRSVLGTGRGRWLAMSAEAGLAGALEAELGAAAAINDQTGAYGLLRLTGPRVREILAKGVNVDLHPLAFPSGAVATIAVAHIGVTLWRVDDVDGQPVFDIAVPRSLAGSFGHWLEASAGEFGLTFGRS